MRVAAIDLFTYRLPTARPLPVGHLKINSRDGVVIRLTAASGAIGWGEAAPLPGLSREAVADILRELGALAAELRQNEVPPGIERLDGRLENWATVATLSPSARCGLEMALLNALAAETGVTLARLLSPDAPETIALNGLLDGPASAAAREYLGRGYTSVKAKVGRHSLDADIELVRALHRELRGQASLRLDANRAWSLEQARHFADRVSDCSIGYIEEPCASSGDLRQFIHSASLAVALDESLLELSLNELSDFSHIAAVVLKPTLLGGFERAAGLARWARERDIKVVVSSSFESSVGLGALAQFAAAFGTPGVAMGLDTAHYLANDLLSEPLGTMRPTLDIRRIAAVSGAVRMDRLMPAPAE